MTLHLKYSIINNYLEYILSQSMESIVQVHVESN